MDIKKTVLTLFGIALALQILAQDNLQIAKAYLQNQNTQLKSNTQTNWIVTDEVLNKRNGITHLYLRQTFQGIEISNVNTNFAIKNGKIVHFTGKILDNFPTNQNKTANISAENAIRTAATHLNLNISKPLTLQKSGNPITEKLIFSEGGISNSPIPVKQVYFLTEDNQLRLAWNLSIDEISQQNWWDVFVDAQIGTILQKNNWVSKCQFDAPNHQHSINCKDESLHKTNTKQENTFTEPQYNVFALPAESPSHGNRSIVINPFDDTASPFGWHDDNGAIGNEYTNTRGNNVNAYEDRNNTNTPGYSPSGGNDLNFDFPANLSGGRNDFLDLAIVNLFYANNKIHDIFYHYGFDEVSGNFQANNYNRGGSANDFVRAEAQDGSGLNNANFGTPPDGNAPRMQMFLWGTRKIFTVNSPASIAGSYGVGTAAFGPDITTITLTGTLALVNDGTANPTLACEAITNTSEIAGKIAVIDRGSCTFASKVKKAQDAGAIAVVIINNVAGNPIDMANADPPIPDITIPSLMITLDLGNQIKSLLGVGQTIQVTFQDNLDASGFRDSDLDNGIIIHEYGHGISNRLTGGPANSSCLNNGEQMGEGWSDYFGLMLTMKSTDTPTMSRGIGTYAIGQATTGRGIREAPYTTDMALNNFTYTQLAGRPVPHGVGFIWCNMLWEMTWNLIDRYGFDEDIYQGNGGNNKALQLVMDGLKLQPCNPGFIDARNAILQADIINNDGANLDIIWAAFAKRGLGVDATQGSVNSIDDNAASFSVPNVANCVANAGFLVPPTNQNLPLIYGNNQTVNAFQVSYNGTTELDPGANYSIYYLLTTTTAPYTILAKSSGGVFSLNTLQQGDYLVWAFSYSKTNTQNDVVTYLANKTTIEQIQAEKNLRIICADWDNRYADGTLATLKIDNTLALESISQTGNIKYFPNPNDGILNISIAQETQKPYKISILTLQGVNVFEKQGIINQSDFKTQADLRNLGKGMYLMKVELNGKVYIDKLILL